MKGLIGLFTAGTISQIGSRMTFLAVPWLVLVTTGSPTRMGLAAAAEWLPYVLAAPLGAPLLDRFGARRIAIGADLASALATAAVALGYVGGFGSLLALLVVAGALRGMGDNAKRMLLPRTIAASGVDITRAASVYDGVNRLAGLLGAGIGGSVIVWLGAPGAVLFDGATFAVCALLVWLLVPADTAGGPVPLTGLAKVLAAPREPYLTAIRGGARYLREDRLMVGILALLFVTNLADQANAAVFVPLWVDQVLHSPIALGFTGGAFALGAVLGNIGFTALAPRAPRYAVFTIGFLLGGAPRLFTLALSDTLTLVLAVSFVGGLAMAAVNPILSAVSFERVPEHLQARVLSLSTAIAYAGIPLGGLVGGWAVNGMGLTWSLALFGGLYLAATLLPVVDRQTWRQLDRRPDAAATVPAPRRPEPAESSPGVEVGVA
ncbi:putative drug antiporter protein precursor [Catellatospora sp. TT07R-123]|uniref:MFS transporter n=1 Tax=Catellatospora sp. TT07R-123 TaxID=2733863 RepID=UPI001B183140|nr:MFS transporter [Catellatospora sp. TT07R-123]GHJ44592.1 putative drug antiporter protein precursor [Catellatospora sp. TT07R-123]